MKKNIALLISIIALVLLLLFLRVNIKKEVNDKSINIISDAIYGYDLQTENQSVNGLTKKNNKIYYLLMNNVDEEKGLYDYKLKELNLEDGKVTTIGNLNETTNYCSIKEESITCLSTNNIQVYNLKLEKIFEYTSKEESISASYAPYKDIYIKIDNNEVYLIRNDNEELYRKIESELTLFYENYLLTADNTYLILFDEEGIYYLYDMNNDNLFSLQKKNYFKYENGLFVYDESSFQVYDFVNNNITEYMNPTQEDYFYSATLNNQASIFYLYDVITNVIFIENLEEGTIKEVDANSFTKGNPIASLISEDNYLCIYILQDKENFVVIDLDKLNIPTTNIEEYNNELTNNISKKIESIKNTYHVNINIKENAIIKFPDFNAEVLLNNELILESLEKVESILSKYDVEVFESFYKNGFDGLNLYLTGKLTPSDYETQASNPAAYSLTYNGEYMIVIDLNQPNIEELLCHELLHNLEFNLNNQNIYPFNKWEEYNPDDFYYNNSYTASKKFNYTLSEEDPNNVYFIDYYSHTYKTEDRARVFERICACESDSIVNEYPHLYQKALYIKEEILKYYPSLNDTSLFNSLNETS